MNYLKIYNDIIKNAQKENRKKGTGVYYEKHHIIPKCISNNNSKENLVLLTFKEHFLCHKLLFVIHKDTKYGKAMSYAFFRMCLKGNTNEKIFSGKYYAEVREIFCKNQSIRAKIQPKRECSAETKLKIKKAHENKILSEETKLKIKNSFTDERKEELGKALKQRLKDVVFNRDYLTSVEYKQKMSNSIKDWWKENSEAREKLAKRNAKKVINLETKQVFDSLKEAAVYENMTYKLFQSRFYNKKLPNYEYY
jgi:hypothetical protein